MVVAVLMFCMCCSVSSRQSRWKAVFEAEGLCETSRYVPVLTLCVKHTENNLRLELEHLSSVLVSRVLMLVLVLYVVL